MGTGDLNAGGNLSMDYPALPAESRNTLSRFMLQKLEKALAWWATWLECRLHLTSDCTDLFSLFQVNVKVDYIKPPSDGFPERTCATVTISGINIAEALISKGFATALRHRQDDDQRSSCYDDLLAAETRAIKNGKGLHSKKESPIHRVADLSGVSQWNLELTFAFTNLNQSLVLFEFVCSRSILKRVWEEYKCVEWDWARCKKDFLKHQSSYLRITKCLCPCYFFSSSPVSAKF